MISIPSSLDPILKTLFNNHIHPIIVGGYVRDKLLNIESKDIDIELYGSVNIDTLEKLLLPYGKINVVGKSFGVIKLSYNDFEIDFTLPRKESKSGSGHKGFDITLEQNLDFAAAALRRDFTINAIGYDPINNIILDPYNGQDHIKQKILTHVNDETFTEDPLRILRAIQFASRFELTCSDALINLCQNMVKNGCVYELPKERIFEEFKKLLLSQKPSIGLSYLKVFGLLPFFAPLEKFESVSLNPISHPNASLWTHTLLSLDILAKRSSHRGKNHLQLMFAVLLHDIGKTSDITDSLDHGIKGVPLALNWMQRITNDTKLTEAILPLIEFHSTVKNLFKRNASDSEILHFSTQVCIRDLYWVALADGLGRTHSLPEDSYQPAEWLYEKAQKLGVLDSAPKPLLYGKDLISLGIIPSPLFSKWLKTAYFAQLDQKFSTHEDALIWLKSYLVTVL